MALTRIETLISTHRLFVGDLRTSITILVWKDEETGWLSATADRHILTPLQISPYFAEPGGFHQTPDSALENVVSVYASYYDEAVRAGHTPAESWLPLQ